MEKKDVMVLVFHEDRGVRFGIFRLLNRDGFGVLGVWDRENAWKLLTNPEKKFHVALIGNSEEGLTLVREIRKEFGDALPIILVTDGNASSIISTDVAVILSLKSVEFPTRLIAWLKDLTGDVTRE